VVARHPGRAGTDDVARVTFVPLAEDDLATAPAPRDPDIGQLRDVGRCQPGEKGNL
jgi:hypothetical protein